MAVARADAMIAVFDAKYHYNFWRPVTAIRNGDIDGNPATERDALAADRRDADASGVSVRALHPRRQHDRRGRALFGSADVPEVSTTSPTLPGVTHRWTNMRALDTEVAEARLGRRSLPLLDPRRPGHGPQDRRARGERRHAAGHCRDSLNDAATGCAQRQPHGPHAESEKSRRLART